MAVGSSKNSLAEVLDFIRHEFDGVSSQAEQARRDIVEYSSHAQVHLEEVSAIRRELSELEREHARAKTVYEDRISDLKRQIETLKAQLGQGPPIPTVLPATTNHFGTLMGHPQGLFGQGGPHPPNSAGGPPGSAGPATNGDAYHRDTRMAIDEPAREREREGGQHLGKRPRADESPYEAHQAPYKSRLSINQDGRSAAVAGLENGAESRTASGSHFPNFHNNNPVQQQEPSVLQSHATHPSVPSSLDLKPIVNPLSLAPPPATTRNSVSPAATSAVAGGRTSPASLQPQIQPTQQLKASPNTSTPSAQDDSHYSHQPMEAQPQMQPPVQTQSHTPIPTPRKPDWDVQYNSKVKKVLDVSLLHTFQHQSVVCCVRISPDGKTLATGCNRMTTLYDTASGAQIVELPDESGSRADNYIRSVAFSPDGKLLATGSEDKIIRLWDLERRAIVKKLEGHTSEIYSLAFTPDGKDIISGSGDKSARIWSLESGTVKHEMSIDEARVNEQTGQPLDGGVTSVAISFDGELLAAGSLDHVVRIWDIKSGKLLDKLKGHRDSVYSVAFIPAGKGSSSRSQILTGSLDKTLKVWDLTPLRTAIAEGKSWDANEGRTPCIQSLAGHKDYVLSVATSGDGEWVVSGSKDRAVQFYDIKTGQPQFALHGHKNSVISIAMSETGGLLATGSGDWQARIFKISGLDSAASLPTPGTGSASAGTPSLQIEALPASAASPAPVSAAVIAAPTPTSAQSAASLPISQPAAAATTSSVAPPPSEVSGADRSSTSTTAAAAAPQ